MGFTKRYEGRADPASADKITGSAIEETSTNLVKEGSILFVVRSGILRHTLPIALAGRDLAINQDLKALEVDPKHDSSFVFYFLRSKSRQILASCMKSGTTVESIDTTALQGFEVPILSRELQAKISLFANSTSDAIRAEATEVESLKNLKKSISFDLFSGRKRVCV